MTRVIERLLAPALGDLRPSAYPVTRVARADGRDAYPLGLPPLAAGFRLAPGIVVIVPGPDGRWYHNPVLISRYALSQHTAAAPGRADLLRTAADKARFVLRKRHG